jgi:hypothetical protein
MKRHTTVKQSLSSIDLSACTTVAVDLANLLRRPVESTAVCCPSAQAAIGQKQAFGSVQEIRDNSFGIAGDFF